MRLVKHFILVTSLCLAIQGFGQTWTPPVTEENMSFDHTDLSNGGSYDFTFDNGCLIDETCNNESHAIDLVVYFGLGDDIHFKPAYSSFYGNVTIEVTGVACTGYTTDFSSIYTLEIDEDAPEQIVIEDILMYFPTLEGLDIEVISYNAPVGYENEITLDISYSREIKVPISVSDVPDPSGVTQIGSSGTYLFEWTTSCADYLNYEIQLLRLYNTTESKTSATDIDTKIDWSTATTIITDSWNKSLRLTLTEGTGYYVWRVRGIGNEDGGYINPDNLGSWSDPGTGFSDGSTPTVTAASAPDLFFYTQFDEDKNWIYNRVMLEGERDPNLGTKIGEGISYANGLSQVQQTQARVSSQEKILASETVYDYSGRPTLNGMGVPLSGRDYLGYEAALLRMDASTPYSAADFDADETYFSPTPAELSGTRYAYYSDENTDPAIPSASKPNAQYWKQSNPLPAAPTQEQLSEDKGYPFSRALYYPDGSGRIKQQSGVGYDHMIGAGAKITAMHYSSVADDELIRVFGYEAPSGNAVHKVFSTDPNGVTSVSYINTMGQTLMNALVSSGENDSDGSGRLDGLATQDIAEFTVYEVINPASVFTNEEYIERKKDLVLFNGTTLTIDYEITPSFIEANCLSACNTCDYFVEIFVLNKETNTKIHVDTLTITPAQVCSAGSTEDLNSTYNVPLAPGSYDVVQRLYYHRPNYASTTGQTYLEEQLADLITDFSDKLYGDYTSQNIDNLYHYVDHLENDDLDGFYDEIETQNTSIDLSTYDEGDLITIPVELQNGSHCFDIQIPYLECYDPNDPDNCPESQSSTPYTDYYNSVVTGPSGFPYDFAPANPTFYTLVENSGTVAPGIIDYGSGSFDDVIDAMLNPGTGDDWEYADPCELWNCWTTICDNYASGVEYGLYPIGEFNVVNEFFDCLEDGYQFQEISNTFSVYSAEPFAYFPYVMGTNTQCEDNFGVTSGTPITVCGTSASGCGISGLTDNLADQMEAFYNCVLYSTPISSGSASTYYDISEQAVTGTCEESCELRAEEFRNELIFLLRDNGDIIEGDEYHYTEVTIPGTSDTEFLPNYASPVTTGYDVSLATIECTVQALVENCKQSCELTQQTDSYGNITFGTTAEIDAMTDVMVGGFDLSLPSGGSCSGSATLVDPSNFTLSTEPSSFSNSSVTWDETHDTDDAGLFASGNDNIVTDIIDISGGYLIASIHHDKGSDLDVAIQKVDNNGSLIWTKEMVGGSSDRAASLVELGGYYYMIGSTNSAVSSGNARQSAKAGGTSDFDFWVVKFDQSGNIIYDATYGGTSDDFALKAVVKNDNILIVGTSASDDNGTKTIENYGTPGSTFDAWVLEIGPGGNVINEYAYGGTGIDAFLDAEIDPYGEIYYAGVTTSGVYSPGGRSDALLGGTDAWVVKVDASGTAIWDQCTGGSANDSFSSMVRKATGELVVAGQSKSGTSSEKTSGNNGGHDYYMVELDPSTGDINWDKTYGGSTNEGPHPDPDDVLSDFEQGQLELVQLSSGNFMLASTAAPITSTTSTRTDLGDGDFSYWFVITDEDGVYSWDRSLGGGSDEFLGGVVQASSGGFIFAGSSDSDVSSEKSVGSADYDTWVLKVGEDCSGMQVCIDWTGPYTPSTSTSEEINEVTSCGEQVMELIKAQIDMQADNILLSILEEYESDYFQTCANPDLITDELSLSYVLGYHHYTLFYYDRAGRLQKTVPPAGVDLADIDQTPLAGDDQSMATTAFDRDFIPYHRFVTSYYYNSLGQLAEQNTPDGGVTHFYYDDISRLRFSQNAKQEAAGTYSYIKYDELGRVIESGESSEDEANGDFLLTANINDVSNYPGNPVYQTEVVKSIYTEEITEYYTSWTSDYGDQKHLRNRISYMIKDTDPTNPGDETFIIYSYDPHGNVKWMVQETPELGQRGVAYDYDLISGNVIQVSFNEGQPDQFFHRYNYDSDNRLLTAETSPDGYLWDVDADYDYYEHGPLRRITLGEDNVQGKDYTYTINGWLKAMNHSSQDFTKDPGMDGLAFQSTVAKDVFGMVLNYFEGDFTKSNSQFDNNVSGSTVEEDYLKAQTNTVQTSNYDNLYNGNISAWSWRQQGVATSDTYYGKTVGYQYRYDELNRIKSANFSYLTSSTWNTTTEYHADYTFDASGNLIGLNRNAYNENNYPLDMDEFSYSYNYRNSPSGAFYRPDETELPPYQFAQNQLNYVGDAGSIGTSDWGVDIKDQSVDNYLYDEIGQLVEDVDEDLDIEWNPSHKVKEITKGDGTTITFTYDAMGNRIGKHVTDPAGLAASHKLDYALDAQGNVMAIYKTTYDVTDEQAGDYTANVHLIEQPIYGSDRLGMRIGEDILVKQTIYDGGVASEVDLNDFTYLTENNTNAIGLHGQSVTFGDPVYGPFYYHDMYGQLRINQVPSSIDQAFIAKGNPGANQFVYEDEFGRPLLYISTTSSSAGDKLTFEGYNGQLALSNAAEGYYKNKTTALRLTDDLMMVISQKKNGDIVYHEVTLNLSTTGIPEVSAMEVNEVISSTAVANGMALLEDHTGTVGHKLFVIENTGPGTAQLVSYEIDYNESSGQITSTRQVEANLTGRYANISLQISPQGDKLAIVGTTRASSGSSFFPVTMYLPTIKGTVFELTDTYDVVTPALTSFTEVRASTQSADFAPSGDYIYYSYESKGGNYLKRFDIANGTKAVSINGKSSVRRTSQGEMIVAFGNATTNGAYAIQLLIDPDQLTNPLVMLSLPTAYYSNQHIRPHFALQAHRIYDIENVFSRSVGGKYYEIKDHLGNVRSVITDQKTVAGNNIHYTFDSGVEGWAGCTQATVTQNNGQLEVTTTGASNCAYKTETTVAAEDYGVLIKCDKGTAPGLELALFGIGTYPLNDGWTYVTFTAAGSSTALQIKPTSTAGNYDYTIDEVIFYDGDTDGMAEATVVSYTDYYPYGMMMPGRYYDGNEAYRYSFQGQERDDEIKGDGNSINYKYRMHDPRLGRFFAVDPLTSKYPHYSPYSFSGNRVIDAVELEGLEPRNINLDEVEVGYQDVGPIGPSDGQEYWWTVVGEGNSKSWQLGEKAGWNVQLDEVTIDLANKVEPNDNLIVNYKGESYRFYADGRYLYLAEEYVYNFNQTVDNLKYWQEHREEFILENGEIASFEDVWLSHDEYFQEVLTDMTLEFTEMFGADYGDFTPRPFPVKENDQWKWIFPPSSDKDARLRIVRDNEIKEYYFLDKLPGIFLNSEDAGYKHYLGEKWDLKENEYDYTPKNSP